MQSFQAFMLQRLTPRFFGDEDIFNPKSDIFCNFSSHSQTWPINDFLTLILGLILPTLFGLYLKFRFWKRVKELVISYRVKRSFYELCLGYFFLALVATLFLNWSGRCPMEHPSAVILHFSLFKIEIQWDGCHCGKTISHQGGMWPNKYSLFNNLSRWE